MNSNGQAVQAAYSVQVTGSPETVQAATQMVFQALVLLKLGFASDLAPRMGETPEERQERLNRAVGNAAAVMLAAEVQELGNLALHLAVQISAMTGADMLRGMGVGVSAIEAPRIVVAGRLS